MSIFNNFGSAQRAATDIEEALGPLLEQSSSIELLTAMERSYATVELVIREFGERPTSISEMFSLIKQTNCPDTIAKLCNHIIYNREDATSQEKEKAAQILRSNARYGTN